MDADNPLDNQYRYWDDVAEEKAFTHALRRNAFLRRVDRRDRILDYGCGYGRTCQELVRLGYAHVTGVDTSEKMILRGRRLFPHLDLKHLDLTGPALPLKDGAYDAVILFAVLTCIPGDAGQRRLMEEIFRIMRPGAIVHISDYWLQGDERNQARYRRFDGQFDAFGVFRLPEGAVVRHHSRAHIQSLLERFQVLDLENIDVVTMNGNRSQGFQYFGRKVA